MCVSMTNYHQQGLFFFIQVYIDTNPTLEAHHKCKSAIQIILSKCEDFAALENLLTPSTPLKIMPHILFKISKVLFNFSDNYVFIIYIHR